MGRILQLLGILAGPVHADPEPGDRRGLESRCFTNAAQA